MKKCRCSSTRFYWQRSHNEQMAHDKLKKLILGKPMYVPVTPGGTMLLELEAKTKKKAWKNLLKGATNIAYPDKKAFKQRGYTVEETMS